MIHILRSSKEPRSYKEICEDCGCFFSCSDEDIRERKYTNILGVVKRIERVVKCPECNSTVYIQIIK